MVEPKAERRKFLRVPVAARVRLKEGGREEIWFTENISEGGLLLKADKPPFVGAQLFLEISLPGSDELVKVPGDVTWRQEGLGCGVRFTRVTAKIRAILRNFLENAEGEIEGPN